MGTEAEAIDVDAETPAPEEVTTPPEDSGAPPVEEATDDPAPTDTEGAGEPETPVDDLVESGFEPADNGGARELVALGAGGGGQPRVTICHRTGSETNPFVEITIALPALQAHLQNHGDIYPVPPDGCPGASGGGQEQVTICHRTGSDNNPFNEITISAAALPAHLNHGDIYPVPEGGCPLAQESIDVCHATGDDASPFVVLTIDASELAAHLAHGDVFPVPDEGCPEGGTEPGGGGGEDDPDGGVLPDRDSGTAAGPSADPLATDDDDLPFTGLSVSALLLIGCTLAFLGWTVRFLYAPQPSGQGSASRFASVEPIAWQEIADEPAVTSDTARASRAAGGAVVAATLAGAAAAYLGWLLNRD